jgi:CHAT domain-containing protein
MGGDTAAAREYFTQALERIDNLPNPDAAENLLADSMIGPLMGGDTFAVDLSQVVTCVREREAAASGQESDTSVCTDVMMQALFEMIQNSPELGGGLPGLPFPGDDQQEDGSGSMWDEPVSPEEALELIEGISEMIPEDGETPSDEEILENLDDLLEQAAEQQPPDAATPGPAPAEDMPATDIGPEQMLRLLELAENPEDVDITTLAEVVFGVNPLDVLGAQVAPMFKPILLNNIAETYRYEENIDMALEYYGQARVQAEQLRADETLPGYQVFADIVEGIVQTNEGLLYFDQAEALRAQGDAATAWGLYRQSLTNYDATLQQMQDFRQRLGIATVLVNRSQVKLRLADLLEADPTLGTDDPALLREEAFTDLQTAVQEVETIRVAGDNRVRDIVAENKLGVASAQALGGSLSPLADVFNFAVLLAHQLGDDAQAFEFGERGRARLLLDMLTTGQLELSDSAAKTLMTQEREQYIMRQLAEDVLEQARVSEDEQYKTLIPALEDQLARAREMYQETRSTIQQQYPQLLPLLEGSGGILDAASVQQELQRLDEPTTLVSYYVIDERVEDDAPALAFVIDAETPDVTAIALPGATSVGLGGPINDLATWYADPSRGDPPEAAFQELHTALIQPLRDTGVLSTTQVGIVPHQELHYVPFAALNDGSEHLIERHALFVLPSASTLKLANDALDIQSPPDDPVALIYGDPTSNRPVLSNAEEEAEAIAHMLGSTAYTGDEATEQRLRAQADDAHLIHLAAHAQYFSGDELSSAIYLAEDADAQHDGTVRAGEILIELPLSSAELVVLSACESSAGTPSTGDEIVSLTRSLITAGSASVISSLWQVDDQATEGLMTDFYTAWQEEGMTKAEALREAQQAAMATYETPYYWGAFVLYGNPDVGKVQFELTAETTPTSTATSTITPEPTGLPVATTTPTNETTEPGEQNTSVATIDDEDPAEEATIDNGAQSVTPTPTSPGCLAGGVILLGAVGALWWSRRMVGR